MARWVTPRWSRPSAELEVLLTAVDLVTLARAAVDFDYQGRRVIGS
jgi:hypothetical protein